MVGRIGGIGWTYRRNWLCIFVESTLHDHIIERERVVVVVVVQHTNVEALQSDTEITLI